jgi:hypothetical protein
LHIALTTTCDDDYATTERWAPFSPPDEFDDADAEWMPAYVLASRGGWGGWGEGKTAMYFCARSSGNWGHGVFFGDTMWVVQRIIKVWYTQDVKICLD